MEGPSLYLASEQLASFKGKKIRIVSGNTKIGKERLLGETVLDIFSWGKHLCFQFENFAIHVHFLLFGTFEAVIEGSSVTGDYKRAKEPRLCLEFSIGEIKMFNCSIKVHEEKNLKSTYDFSIDTMSKEWDSEKALKNVLINGDEQIGDVLLDQEVFAGVGNIIKNEVLFRKCIHPTTLVSQLSLDVLTELIKEIPIYTHQFYEWRKRFELKKHYQIYRQKECPKCGNKIVREKTGKKERWSFICTTCQIVDQ